MKLNEIKLNPIPLNNNSPLQAYIDQRKWGIVVFLKYC